MFFVTEHCSESSEFECSHVPNITRPVGVVNEHHVGRCQREGEREKEGKRVSYGDTAVQLI